MNSKCIVKTQELMKQLPVNITLSKINSVTVHYLTPHDVDERHKDHIFVGIHGGAFLLNGEDGSIQESVLKIPVASIDYRTFPEHPFPAPLDDLVTCIRDY